MVVTINCMTQVGFLSPSARFWDYKPDPVDSTTFFKAFNIFHENLNIQLEISFLLFLLPFFISAEDGTRVLDMASSYYWIPGLNLFCLHVWYPGRLEKGVDS